MHFLCRFMGAFKILLILGGIDEGFNAITFLCYKLLQPTFDIITSSSYVCTLEVADLSPFILLYFFPWIFVPHDPWKLFKM